MPHGSPTFAARCQKCAPLRQPSFQRRTRRARHLASWALDRDRILPDLGFIVYRIIQDSFVRSLPLFRLRDSVVPLLPSHLLSHRTQDDTPLPLLEVAYLYITTLAFLDQERDQSRTLSMQYTFYSSRSRVVAVSGSPCVPLRYCYDSLRVLPAFRACGHSLPLYSYSLSSPSRLCFPSRIANLGRISGTTLRTRVSVELPPELQYFSELFKNPDGLGNDGVQVSMRTVERVSHCK